MQKIKTIFKQIFGKITVFLKDHFHLIFKSTKKNYERINNQETRNKTQDTKNQETRYKEQDTNGRVAKTNLEFQSFNHLERYQKKVRILTFSSSFTIVLVLAIVIGFQFFGLHSKGAVFGWIQSTWSGGADTVNFPNNTSNQTNWTKYYSKDATVSAGDTVSLSASSGTSTQTTDADFGAWTKTNGYVKAGTNHY